MQPASLVHVIDDDEAVRQSLAFLLEHARASRFAPTSPPQLSWPLCRSVEPGCIVTDVRMPEMSGIDLLHRLKERKVGDAGDRHHRPRRRAACRGGDEDRRGGFHREAVRRRGAAARGQVGARQRREGRRSRTASAPSCSSKLAALSSRERDVLEGLVAGKPNKIIAFDLGISPRTVEIYRANVMTKMEAGSLSDLVRMALIAGALKNAADE